MKPKETSGPLIDVRCMPWIAPQHEAKNWLQWKPENNVCHPGKAYSSKLHECSFRRLDFPYYLEFTLDVGPLFCWRKTILTCWSEALSEVSWPKFMIKMWPVRWKRGSIQLCYVTLHQSIFSFLPLIRHPSLFWPWSGWHLAVWLWIKAVVLTFCRGTQRRSSRCHSARQGPRSSQGPLITQWCCGTSAAASKCTARSPVAAFGTLSVYVLCMCVCVCACMWNTECVCVCVQNSVCVCVCVCMCMHVCVCACMHVCACTQNTWERVCVCVWNTECVLVCVCVCVEHWVCVSVCVCVSEVSGEFEKDWGGGGGLVLKIQSLFSQWLPGWQKSSCTVTLGFQQPHFRISFSPPQP